MIKERNPRSLERRPSLPPRRGRKLSHGLFPVILHAFIAGCGGSSTIPAECLHPYIQHLAGDISRTAREAKVPEEVVGAVLLNERWEGQAVGPAGEVGPFQITPDTAELMCERLGISPCDSHDEQTNVKLGVGYLGLLFEVYDGNVIHTIRAFNGGTNGKDHPDVDVYEQRFIANREQIRACASQSIAREVVPSKPSETLGGLTHTVQSGETLAKIANQYGVTVSELARVNGIANPNWIQAGAVLTIIVGSGSTTQTQTLPEAPTTGGTTYTIQKGDRLADIANRNGISDVYKRQSDNDPKCELSNDVVSENSK